MRGTAELQKNAFTGLCSKLTMIKDGMVEKCCLLNKNWTERMFGNWLCEGQYLTKMHVKENWYHENNEYCLV